MGSMRSNKRAAAKSQFIHLYGAKLRSDILTSVRKSNEKVQPERRVSVASAITVANRDLANTLSYSANVRYFSAIRAVNAFVALATKNKQTPQSLSNSDLLPVGHPASTRAHAMTASAFLHAQARWIAADPMIDDSVRSLVASAHAARPGSIERTHAFTRLSIVGFGKAPSYVLIDEAQPAAITASFLVGKNSSAARRLRAQMQRRDRRGRFAFMGGGWSFNLRLPNGMFKAVSGRVVGQSGDDGVEIEVRVNRHLPNGVYTMPAGKGESVAAILSEEAVKDLPDVDVYVGTDDVFADSDDLIATRMDAPSGWARQVTGTTGGEPSRLEWTNEETGYTVQEDLEGTLFGKPTKRELTLRRGLDNEYVARGSSWGDIQKAIDKDQPEYLKKIAEFDRAEEEKKAPKPEAPLLRGEDLESKKPSVDDVQKAIDAGEDISFMYNGKERTLKPEGMWLNPKTGMTNVYGFDKDANDKRTYTVEKMEASPSKAPKPSKAAAAQKMQAIDGDSVEKRKEQIDSAIEKSETVLFDYNDQPRIFTPERTYFNSKNGKTNAVGYSHTDGEDRTFAIDNI